MMENPNCAYFRNNFFVVIAKNIMQTVREKKTLAKNLCFFAYGENQRKRTKKTKNSDERIAKNVRNVGKIRLYEKISITRRDTLEYPAARPLHRR